MRHLIHAGVDPHTVMAFSGHRTDSMLKRYHIIAPGDMRRTAAHGSGYKDTASDGPVIPLAAGTRRERAE